MEVDFYFFADERERYWNRKIPLVGEGDFRRVELRRYRVAGEAVMPGLALALHPRRYDAVVKSLNGKLMLPLVYGASRARGAAVRALDRDVAPPPHRLSPRHATAHPARLSLRRGDRGLRRARRALPRRRRPTSKPARSSWPDRRSSPSASPRCARRATARPRCSSSDSSRSARACADLLGAFAAVPDDVGATAAGGQRVARARGRAARGARPAPGGRRLPAAGAPSRRPQPSPLPRAAVDHHRTRPRALGARRQRGDARRRPRHRHRRRRRRGRRPRPATTATASSCPSAIRERSAAAIRRLASDPELAARLGDQARRDVERFSHRAMADAFEAAVEHAIATSSR